MLSRARDNADARPCRWVRANDAVAVVAGVADARVDAQLRKLFLDGASCGIDGAPRLSGGEGAGARINAPVIENMGHMDDGPCRDRRCAQGKVVILAAFEIEAKSAELAHQRRSVNAEMADEILAVKELRIPIRLEISPVTTPLIIELVLIGVEDVGVGMAVDRVRYDGECVRRQKVIVVEQDEEIAGR